MRMAADEAQALQGPAPVGRLTWMGNELVAGQDKLPHLSHERVEELDVDADGALARRPSGRARGCRRARWASLRTLWAGEPTSPCGRRGGRELSGYFLQ